LENEGLNYSSASSDRPTSGNALSAHSDAPDEALSKISIISEIRTAIQEVRDLPTLPDIALRVMKVTNDPNSSIPKIVEAMEQDVALTGKVLRAANSAYYGVPRKIDSLRMALVVIGMDEVSTLVSAASVLKTFKIAPGSDWDAAAFWFHSAAVAELTCGLYDMLSLSRPGGAYVAALLHDVGKFILSQHFPTYHARVRQQVVSTGVPEYKAEAEILGVDHGHVGAWLIQRWNLPEEITSAVGQHHIRPSDYPKHGLAEIIDYADQLFYKLHGKNPEQVIEDLREDQVWREWIGSRGKSTPVLVQEMFTKMDRATRLLEILK
jgi:putative nucleotidyltransferase with HDIG domain